MLDGWWVVVEDSQLGRVLRVAADQQARELWPTQAEAEQRLKEAAEARVRELEDELRNR